MDLKKMEEYIVAETTRLKLRDITPEIAADLFATQDDARILSFLGLANPDEVAVMKTKLVNNSTPFISFRHFIMVDKASGKAIGSCGYHTWFKRHNRAEVGYSIYDETFKRQGLMKEALPEVIRLGFEDMGLHRIDACVGPDNVASNKLVQALGFKQEGLMREHYLKDGIYYDSFMYALLRREWEHHNPMIMKQ